MKELKIWQGVYSSFNEAPKQGAAFEDPKVLVLKAKSFQKKFQVAKFHKEQSQWPTYGESLLPMVVAMSDHSKPLSILDFGGGFGATYLRTRSAVSKDIKFRYTIVDLPGICKEARHMFKGNKELSFMCEIPTTKYDIVHLGSSLQYIEDWRQVLTKLSKICGDYLLLTDLLIGNIPTYATSQNYFGSKMPVWFLNREMFLKTMKGLGFKLVLRSDFDSNVFGKYEGLPQGNFKKKYRLGKTCSLLFKK